jgi:hypothetical protein
MSKVNHRRLNLTEPRLPKARRHGVFDHCHPNRKEKRQQAGYKQHLRHQQRAADRRELVAIKQSEPSKV